MRVLFKHVAQPKIGSRRALFPTFDLAGWFGGCHYRRDWGCNHGIVWIDGSIWTVVSCSWDALIATATATVAVQQLLPLVHIVILFPGWRRWRCVLRGCIQFLVSQSIACQSFCRCGNQAFQVFQCSVSQINPVRSSATTAVRSLSTARRRRWWRRRWRWVGGWVYMVVFVECEPTRRSGY